MSDVPPRVVNWPSDEETRAAFEEYTLAIGKVAFAWNHLHEKLALLFAVVTATAERSVALAIWYSLKSDRAQRQALRAAVSASVWPHLPQAPEELLWLIGRADQLAERRNDAVHAPASFYIKGGPDGGGIMGPAFWTGNPRAKKLVGKMLLQEFAWCEQYAEILSVFTQKLESGLAFPNDYPWPERPSLPEPPV